MKVKVNSIIYMLLIMLILIDTRLLYFNNVNQLLELSLAVLALFFAFITSSREKKSTLQVFPYLRKVCVSTIISFMIVYAYSLFKYHNQTLMGTFVGDSSHYKMLLIVLLVPLAKLCLDNGGTKWLFKMMNVFAALLYFLVAVQFVIYNLNKTVFLHAMSAGSDIPLLNGTLRISLSWIGNLMILYNFHMFYKDTKDKQTNKVKHFVLFAIGFVELIVISRVRGTTLAVTIGILVLIFADRSTQKTMMKKMLIVVILLYGFFGTDIVSNFLDSFSLDATRAYSTTARLYAIDFYWSAFLKNPLFGIGFADGTVNATVVHGDGRANVSDVGIFAQIAKYGIFILPVYILPLIHSGKRIAIIWKMNYVENRQLYLALFMYVLVSSISLVSIDHFRMLQWPIFLVTIEMAYWSSINRIKIEEV